jgi:hypothetical protein
MEGIMSDQARNSDLATGRRRMLLAGTALATIGALAAGGPVQQAQAQQTPARLPARSRTSW